jgi:PAS domain S-box-containing protein
MLLVMNHSTFKDRFELWRWLLPIGLAAVMLLYQSALDRWLHDTLSDATHFVVEVFFFVLVGPLLVFLSLTRIKRWMAESEEVEAQARTNERWLASITAASADAILSLDRQGYIESWNHGAELLFGYPAAEMYGRSLAAIFGPGDTADVEARWLGDTVRRDGLIRGHETTVRCADGRETTVELTATHITDDQDHTLGVSIILRDITRRKQREEEIRELNASLKRQVAARTRELAEKVEALAQANAELQKLDQTRAELVSLVSHQIRVPLTNVRGAVERMQIDCPAVSPTCQRMFAITEQQVARLDRLVQEVLNATRIEAGELILHTEPISVLPVERQAVEQEQARLSERTIHTPDTPGLPLVYADRDRVAEVLANLLDNADKYSPPNEDIYLQVRADEETVTVSVRDCGPGLTEEALDHVFDKYFRADSSDTQAAYGYGLGLYVCRRLVEAQNGRIWAENHPDGGAVFSMSLPVWQDFHG